MMIIPQTRVISNNTIKKLMAVILQSKVADNNVLEKSLVNFLIKNQLDGFAKNFIDS